MPSQPTLRPFDIGVALRLLLVPEDRYEPLAEALATSTSAVHRSVARLQQSGLCGRSSRTVARTELREFLLHGVRYAFPAILGNEGVGLATGAAHPAVRPMFGSDAESRVLVWSSTLGTTHGTIIAPLFPGVPAVASRDARLHELLAMVDALRAGNAGERATAGEWFTGRLADQP